MSKKVDHGTRLFTILPLLVVIFLLQGCGYNTILGNEEGVNRAWADLDSQLQRRADLVPNLVATVRGAAAHERETLEAVTEARSRAGSIRLDADDLSDPEALARFRAAQDELGGALSRLLVIAEQYPQLRANDNFRDLQHQLEGTENRISVARQRYNERVETFNLSIRRFPTSLTNTILLRLKPREYYRAAPGSETAPRVEF